MTNILQSKFNFQAHAKRLRFNFCLKLFHRYNQLLTPFIFKKIQEQYELSELIEFVVWNEESGITKKAREVGHKVTERNCSCMYFSAMKIPCRHIFQFLKLNEQDLFVPDLIEQRWTHAYFYKSHPALNNANPITAPRPISFSSIRVPEEVDKYKKTAKVTKDINNFVASMSNSQFEFFFDKIKDMRNEIISANKNGSSEESPTTDACASDSRVDLPNRLRAGNFTTSIPFANESTNGLNAYNRIDIPETTTTNGLNAYNRIDIPETTTINGLNVYNRIGISGTSMVPSGSGNEMNWYRRRGITETVTTDHQQQLHPQSHSQQLPTKQLQFVASTSQPATRNDMARVILPPSIVPVGRPKGKVNKAISLKRKIPATPSKSGQPPKKIKFLDRKVSDQGPLMVQWLTNWPLEKVRAKKVANGDIIQDTIIFNRLKNTNLQLNCMKKFLDKKTFKYILDEVDRLNEMPYTCTKCKKYLNGLQIMCHGCLDWYHAKCIGVTNKQSNDDYFCSTCYFE